MISFARNRIASTRSFLVTCCLGAALAAGACGGGGTPGDDDGGDGAADAAPTTPDAATECPVPAPAPEMCDLFLGCGCNTPTEKCSVVTDMRACVNAGASAAGATCASDIDCAAGTVCASPVNGGTKRCLAFCDPSHPCADTTACYITVSGLTDAKLCGQSCDLRGQDCEFAEQGCYPSSANQPAMEKGICAAAGVKVAGDDCAAANDCAEGLTCISDDNKCHALCDRGGGAPTCAAGTCQPLQGHTDTGYCN